MRGCDHGGDAAGQSGHAVPLLATPTELQGRAFELLEIDPAKDVAMQVTGWIRRNRPLVHLIAKDSSPIPK